MRVPELYLLYAWFVALEVHTVRKKHEIGIVLTRVINYWKWQKTEEKNGSSQIEVSLSLILM